jgi:GTP-binding protein
VPASSSGWHGPGPVYRVSALAGEGTDALCQVIMRHLEQRRQLEAENPRQHSAERAMQNRMQAEARERIEALAEQRRQAREVPGATGSDEDGDEPDVFHAP